MTTLTVFFDSPLPPKSARLTVDPKTNRCTECGAGHSHECPDCRGHGFHKGACAFLNTYALAEMVLEGNEQAKTMLIKRLASSIQEGLIDCHNVDVIKAAQDQVDEWIKLGGLLVVAGEKMPNEVAAPVAKDLVVSRD